jgi:hypothetical protein
MAIAKEQPRKRSDRGIRKDARGQDLPTGKSRAQQATYSEDAETKAHATPQTAGRRFQVNRRKANKSWREQ